MIWSRMLLMEKTAAETLQCLTPRRRKLGGQCKRDATRMSIIGQATDAQSAAGWSDLLILLALALLGAVSVVVAARVGIFRRGSIVGPPRVGEREPLGMLVMVLGMAVLL